MLQASQIRSRERPSRMFTDPLHRLRRDFAKFECPDAPLKCDEIIARERAFRTELSSLGKTPIDLIENNQASETTMSDRMHLAAIGQHRHAARSGYRKLEFVGHGMEATPEDVQTLRIDIVANMTLGGMRFLDLVTSERTEDSARNRFEQVATVAADVCMLGKGPIIDAVRSHHRSVVALEN